MAARRFLYVIAGVIALILAAAIVWNLFQDSIMRAAFVPTTPYAAPPAAGAPDYTQPAAWLSRPGLPRDPSRWTPPGVEPAEHPGVAVFYIPPTTYLRRDHWNAPLDDADANDRLRLFANSQASAFNGVGAIWAPRYRQATLGAFLTSAPDAAKALDFAYADVLAAFDRFVASIPADQPILLAGHSQGALHLSRLLRERIAGKPIAARIVAAYVVGWPLSIPADLPALGLPGCATRAQANCILSWQSFAEPADPHQILALYDASTGYTGKPRRGTPMLCTNPLTGTPNTAAPATKNLGALVPGEGLAKAEIVAAKAPARCDGRGFLLIGAPPEGYGLYVLPGNNYHVFDYALFWSNIRADAATRTQAFLAHAATR